MSKHKQIKLVNFNSIIGLDLKELYVVDGELAKPESCNLNPESFFTIDCENCIISPGFIDPQVNGLRDCDFWSEPAPSFEAIDELRLALAKSGVVAFCPTIITSSEEKTLSFLDHIKEYTKSSKSPGSKILGVHIEGKFITKYGVHEEKYSNKNLTPLEIEKYLKDNVEVFTLAPELDKTGEAIKLLQENKILVSAGHTNATYAEGERAINEYGIDTCTHMFNAMKGVEGFSHRCSEKGSLDILKSKLEDSSKINPNKDGIMLSLFKNKNVLAMTITDGVHVNKEAISLLNEYKSDETFGVVSDLVSTSFFEAAKKEGSLGGGQITIDKCVKNLIDWNISSSQNALLSGSFPIATKLKSACNIGLGKLSFNNEANLIIWNTLSNEVQGTIIGENAFLNK